MLDNKTAVIVQEIFIFLLKLVEEIRDPCFSLGHEKPWQYYILMANVTFLVVNFLVMDIIFFSGAEYVTCYRTIF